MTTLRVLIDELPDPARAAPWSLFDDASRIIRCGIDAPAAWPGAARMEAVIAARHGRLVTITLPPLPASRVEAAARYALEDQLAGVAEEHHLALGPQRPNGALPVAIVADEWMRAFTQASQQCGVHWARAILESDLVLPPENSWCWCAGSVRSSGCVSTQ